jgi:hypothetical protein
MVQIYILIALVCGAVLGMIMPTSKLFRTLLSSSGEASSRRFVVVIVSMIFCALFLTMVVLLILTYVGNIRASAQAQTYFFQLFEKVVDYCVWIILVGFGFITSSALIGALGDKFRAKVISAQQGIPDNVVVQNVKEQQVNAQNTNIGVKTAPAKAGGIQVNAGADQSNDDNPDGPDNKDGKAPIE